MKHLKLFEYYTNPYDPNDIWEDGVKLSELKKKKKFKRFLKSLRGKKIVFSSNGNKIGPVILKDYHLYNNPDAHLIDLEDDPFFVEVYFMLDDNDNDDVKQTWPASTEYSGHYIVDKDKNIKIIK